MSCSDPRAGSSSDWYGAAEGLDNGDDTQLEYWAESQVEVRRFGRPPSHAPLNPESIDVNPSNLGQQPVQTVQFVTSPQYAISMHLQPPHQGGTSKFATTPNHAEVNPGSMTFQPYQGAQQPGGPSQFATTPNHAEMNSGSMNIQPYQLAQQPGTSQPSNITNAADAARKEKIRESKRKSWKKRETERKDNEKMLAEATKVNGDLLEANERLGKEVGEEKVKLKSVKQELSYCKAEVSRLKKQLRGQTKLVDVLSKRLVASPEATYVAEENKQLKRQIELLTTATNNPDIIKTVLELQEQNENLEGELKKLRVINDALCVTLIKDEQ